MTLPIDRNSITHFGLLRHGKTIWNEKGKIQGRCNSPLTETGKQEIQQWAYYLKGRHWDRIFHSDLGRVVETAHQLNTELNLPMQSEPLLREQDWGDWEGMTLKELKQTSNNELSRQEKAGWDFCPPGGESRKQVLNRVSLAISQAAEKWPGETILTICHQGVIKCILYDVMGREFLPHEKNTINKNNLHLIEHTKGKNFVAEINIARVNR